MALSALKVKNAKAKAKPYKLADEKGLYLLVTPTGSKLWRFNFRHDGKYKTLAFGSWPDVELVTARGRRDEARRVLAAGREPGKLESLNLSDAEKQFAAVARDWHAASKPSWSPRYAKLVLGRLEADIFPHLGKRPVDEIEPPELLFVIRKIEARGAIEMAKRVKNHCGEVFRYGIAEGKCKRDPSADIRSALRRPYPKRHRARVPSSEISALFTKIANYDGEPQTKLALRFTLLNMVRTQETRFAQWAEFEHLTGSAPIWRLSPERMKMSREHIVPLARQSVELLQQIKQISGSSPYLFPTFSKAGVISENTMLYALYRMGYHSKQTVHGFRGIASTVLNESGQFNGDWIELQLAHGEENEVRSAYNSALYLKQRAQMMQWWADFVNQQTA
jgi:integrase